mgnify:FL=1
MINIEDLLGIPFKIHGRDKNGLDCYGLAIEVSKRFGHKMVDMFYDYNSTNNLQDLNDNTYNITSGSGLIKTEQPCMSDVLLFFDSKNRTTHIGIYLSDDNFIHCDGDGVHISKLSSYFRKWSAYKWQN